MADQKISELVAITEAAAADEIAVVDTSAGTTNKITYDNITGGASKTELGYVAGVTSAIQTQIDGKEPTKGVDDNFVTDAEKIVIGNTSGTNTGDMSNADVKIAYEANADTNEFSDAEQTKLAGIETGAEVNNISDVNATDLTDGGATTLHSHTSGSIEGTAVLSTGEIGGNKFLREDGDGTSSWQTISGGGDMLASTYDTDGNGKVDTSDALITHAADTTNPHTVTSAQLSITDTNSKFVATDVDGAIDEIGETKNFAGFDRQVDASLPDIAFTNATRTFDASVKVTSSDFYFWVDGSKVTKTTTQSVVIPDTTDTYYIYFDTTGTMQYLAYSSVTDDMFHKFAIVGLVRWNATQGTGGAGDERHGIRMSGSTHHYNHDTFGARYGNGFNPTGFTNGVGTYTNIASGTFWDEDIEHTHALSSTNSWLYRLGSAGEWTTRVADNLVGVKDGVDTYFSWNENTGATWQLTQGGATTDFWITFFVATPGLSGGNVVKMMGQNAYSSRLNARNAIEAEINNITTDGLPSPETLFLYAVIVKRDGTLVDLADGSTYYDLRSLKGGSGGSSSSAQFAADVATDTTNFAGILSAADTDVQTALDTIDDITLGITDVVSDTTPQLGGELDSQAHSIGFTMQTATGVVGTTAIDFKLGNHVDFTFGAGNETFTFTAPSKPGVYTITLKQDSVGSRTVTFPATVKWAGGAAPTLTTTASTGYDIISFRYDGTNYYSVASLDFS